MMYSVATSVTLLGAEREFIAGPSPLSSVSGPISLSPPVQLVPLTTLYATASHITLPSQGPLPPLRRPTSVSEGTWCRQGGELPKETGIDVALARSPPNRRKTLRTHKEPLQRPRLGPGPGPGPEEPVPPPHSGAIFGLSVVTMEYVTPLRRRQPRPSRQVEGLAGEYKLFDWLASCASNSPQETRIVSLREASQ